MHITAQRVLPRSLEVVRVPICQVGGHRDSGSVIQPVSPNYVQSYDERFLFLDVKSPMNDKLTNRSLRLGSMSGRLQLWLTSTRMQMQGTNEASLHELFLYSETLPYYSI